MIKHNAGDDIKLRLQVRNRGEVINPDEVRWTVRVYTESRDKAVLCTHDDSGYINCYVQDNYIVLAIDNPELVSGILRVMITLYYEDDDMADGYRTESVMMREVESLSDSIAEGVADISVVGYSAYRIAVMHGFEGTEEEWLESLKGEPGEPGVDGEPGEPGRDGEDADIEGCNEAIERANAATDAAQSATASALAQAKYAKEQGDNAKTQGDNAKTQAEYAKEQGDYAKEQGDATKQAIADSKMATENANTATENAKTATDNANTAADNATGQAGYAKEMGDYAKEMGDAAAEGGDWVNYLTFKATGASNTIAIKQGTPTACDIEYRLVSEGVWKTYTLNTIITVAAHDSIQFRGNNKPFNNSHSNLKYFVMTGYFRASGDVFSLYDKKCITGPKPSGNANGTSEYAYCFCGLFSGCTSLLTPPELSATWVWNNFYRKMFEGCANLKYAPKLDHITGQVNWCFERMFYGCSSLIEMPILPPGLGNNSMESMFAGCVNIRSADLKNITVLGINGAQYMFKDCISLRYVKSYLSSHSFNSTTALQNWLYGVSPTGIFVDAGTKSDWTTGTSGIPDGWVVEKEGGESDMLIENIKNIIIASGGKTYILQLPEDVYDLAMADSEVIALLAEYPNFIIVK